MGHLGATVCQDYSFCITPSQILIFSLIVTSPRTAIQAPSPSVREACREAGPKQACPGTSDPPHAVLMLRNRFCPIWWLRTARVYYLTASVGQEPARGLCGASARGPTRLG